jgi:hypothetical protein
MENDELNRELQELEHSLASDPWPEPPTALRQRVLLGIRAELDHDRMVSRWRFAAVAAALLLWLSFSLAATQVITAALSPRQPQQSVVEVAKRIQKLSPDLSPDESLRQAMLFQSAVALGASPSLEDRYAPNAADNSTTRGAVGREERTMRGGQRPERPDGNPQTRGLSSFQENDYV